MGTVHLLKYKKNKSQQISFKDWLRKYHKDKDVVFRMLMCAGWPSIDWAYPRGDGSKRAKIILRTVTKFVVRIKLKPDQVKEFSSLWRDYQREFGIIK